MYLFTKPDQLLLGTFGPLPLRIPVHLRVPDLTSHMAVNGATRSGKSRLLAHIALSLIERGEAITLLDPHGDTARLVMAHLISRGQYKDPGSYDRITYLDLPAAARVGRFTPFNILAQPFDTPTIARLVLEAFRRAWPALDDGVAPAFENAVLAGVSVLIRHKLPIIFLHDLFTDAMWRGELLAEISDPTVRSFFARLDRWGSREQAQFLESTLRRAFLLSFSPVLRYSLGQGANRLGAIRGRMDRGESLIVNLALPDSDARHLLGALLTVFYEQGALQRADTDTAMRGRQHTLIIDEFGDLAARSGVALQHILEQCRKYGLGLILASQSNGQMAEPMRRAMAGVGTTIVFRLGREDAEEMARRIGITDPSAIKHAGDAGAAHPLYTSLPEQWEAWTATIQGLRPRQMLVGRPPAPHHLLRRHAPRVARLRTPDLPDPVVDPTALATVEDHYLMEYFTVQPLIEAELAAHRVPVAVPLTASRRRVRRV